MSQDQNYELDGELNDAMGYFRRGLFADAEAGFLRAMNFVLHDDEYSSVLRKMAILYEKMGRPDDAQECWEHSNTTSEPPPRVTGVDPDGLGSPSGICGLSGSTGSAGWAVSAASAGSADPTAAAAAAAARDAAVLRRRAAAAADNAGAQDMVQRLQAEHHAVEEAEAMRDTQNRRFVRSVVEMSRAHDVALSKCVEAAVRDGADDDGAVAAGAGVGGAKGGALSGAPSGVAGGIGADTAAGGSGTAGSGAAGSGAASAAPVELRPRAGPRKGRPRRQKKSSSTLDELRKMVREPELEGMAACKMGKMYTRLRQFRKAFRNFNRALKAEQRQLALRLEAHTIIAAEEKKSRSRTKRAEAEREEAQVSRYLEVVKAERLISDCHRSLYDLILKAAPDLAGAAPVANARPGSGGLRAVAAGVAFATSLLSSAAAAASPAERATSPATTAASSGTGRTSEGKMDLDAFAATSTQAGTPAHGSDLLFGSGDASVLIGYPSPPSLNTVDLGSARSFLLPGQPAAAKEAMRLESLCSLHGRKWLQSLSLRVHPPEHAADRFAHPLKNRFAQLRYIADRSAGVTNGPIAMLRTEALEEMVRSGPGSVDAALLHDLGVLHLEQNHNSRAQELFERAAASPAERAEMAEGRRLGLGPMGLGVGDGTWEAKSSYRSADMKAHGTMTWSTMSGPDLVRSVNVPALSQAAVLEEKSHRRKPVIAVSGEWRKVPCAGYGGTLGAPDIRRGDKLPEVRVVVW